MGKHLLGSWRRLLGVMWCVAALRAPVFGQAGSAPAGPKLDRTLVFTDEVVGVEGVAGPVRYSVERLDRSVATQPVQLEADGASLRIAPVGEGLHVIHLQKPTQADLRFLAIAPPEAPLTVEQVRKVLPRTAESLFGGKPVRIVAVGDSVTATGDFPEMLGMILRRMTGNKQIEVRKAAYPGRSADAGVRHWERDVAAWKPNLVLVMFGLNDQAASVPRQAFLEHYAWMVNHARDDFGGEVVFLQPTPHIEISTPGGPQYENAPDYILRTAGYAHAVTRLGSEMKIPVAQTFDAIWGDGGADLPQTARNLWPLYPPSYSRQFERMVESGGKGDTIHLNAVGHLRMARAVCAAMGGQTAAPLPLSIEGTSRWTATGVESTWRVKNTSTEAWSGTISFYPPTDGVLETGSPCRVSLAVGETTECVGRWTQVKVPEDLLKCPADRYLAQNPPEASIVLTQGERSRVTVVQAPFEVPARVLPQRAMAGSGEVALTIQAPGGDSQVKVRIPADSQVGRIPVVQRVDHAGKTGWAVGELAYVRVLQVTSGEAKVDGNLDEWRSDAWAPIGEPVQARWTHGHEDHRVSPDEAYIQMAMRAGTKGLTIAFKGKGKDLSQDSFTVFFDPRSPEQLGTVGPYFWIGGGPDKRGVMEVRAGETSDGKEQPTVKVHVNGEEMTAEVAVPYGVLGIAGWPATGDMGLGVDWAHRGPKGLTHLQWSEDGHPWNPRWYGVVTLKPMSQALYRIRVD